MPIKININGDGLNYEGETNLHKAAQIIAFLGTEHANLSSNNIGDKNSNSRAIVLPGNKSATPRQLIIESGANTNVQKISVIGKYYKEIGQDVFTRSEIIEQLRRAGETAPKNIGRDLKEAVKAGYICESSEQRDEYFLTEKGEEAISQGFGGSEKTKKTKSKSNKGKISTIEPSNLALKNITFTPKNEGIVDYFEIKKGDRILWILHVAKLEKISEMTNKDIEYVAKNLDDNISSSNVEALTKVNRKNSYLTKKGTTYTILGPGIKYIESLLATEKDAKDNK